MASVPVNDGAKVKVPPEFVMFKTMLVSVEVASVIAPVCAVPNECWSDETAEVSAHVPLIAKQPDVTLMPFPNDEVAVPVTSSLSAVVEPVELLSERMDDVVVANVVTDEVETYSDELIALKLNGALVVEPSASVSCGAVDEATLSAQRGVVVPIPTTGEVTPFT
jgi:hypothetical protein